MIILLVSKKSKVNDHCPRLDGFMITVYTHNHKRKRSETLRARPPTLAPTLTFPEQPRETPTRTLASGSTCTTWYEQAALPRPPRQPGQLLAVVPLPVFNTFETPCKEAQLGDA